ncbi:MAG: hypothetical protein HQK75_18315 [Candidatus Magnetomorum sp.]|nr:hypothetical protein [Candidatus Magnetomorum sp.]
MHDVFFFEDLINGWQKKNLLDKYCYVSIGKKYFEFYEQDLTKKEHLTNAIKYLEYASKNLTISDQPEYRDCYKTLIISESYRTPPRIELVFKYNNYVPEDMLKNSTVLKNIINSCSQTALAYKKNPFNVSYPLPMMNDIDGLKETFDEKQKQLFNEIKEIYGFVSTYQSELKLFEKTQSYDQVNKILAPILSLEEKRVSTAIDTVQAIKKLKQYYEQINSLNTSMTETCISLGDAIDNLSEAQKIFPFLTDTKNANCLKEFACLSKEIQQNFIDLMPDHSQKNTFNQRLTRCQNYLQKYTDTISHCQEVQIINDQQSQLNDMIAFYEAYNCLSSPPTDVPPTTKLQEFMTQIQANSSNDAKKLYTLAGFYNADYYYQKSSQRLLTNPGKNRNQVLDCLSKYTRRLKSRTKTTNGKKRTGTS